MDKRRVTPWTDHGLLLAFLVAALCIAAHAQGIGEVVTLTSTSVSLSTPASLLSSTSASAGTTTGSTTRTATADGSDNADDKNLYLVRSVNGGTKLLRDSLVELGVSVDEVVDDVTLLVYGVTDDVITAAMNNNALMAEFIPAAKISPGTAHVIRTMRPAAKRRSNYRRTLAQSSDASTTTTTSSTSGPAMSLSSLQTWGSYGALSETTSTSTDASGDGPSPAPSSGQPQTALPLDSAASPRDRQQARDSKQAGPDLYAFSVRLVVSAPPEKRAEVLESWPVELAAHLDRTPDSSDFYRPRLVDAGLSRGVGSAVVHLYVCDEDVEKAITWITQKKIVVWTEPLFRAKTNNALASWTLQTGNLTERQFFDPNVGVRPYWNASIQGQGVVVGMGDTGIDMSNCYFVDNNYRPGRLRGLFVGRPPRLYLPNHRKVIQYLLPETAIMSWFGDNDGHGTSMAGSIAGSILNPDGSVVADDATGSAPLSRLSMYDYSSPDSRGALYIPRPIDDKILPFHLGVGARLSAETWTLPSSLATKYMEDSRQFDAFAWRNPDFLSVVAVGNYGENTGLPNTVVAPATAKNVLSVGATVNHPKNFNASSYNMALYFRYRNTTGATIAIMIWPSLASSLTRWRDALKTDTVFRMASPENACSPLLGTYMGTMVLVDAGGSQTCSYTTRIANVFAKGAIGVLFIAPSEGFVEETDLMGQNLPVTTIPSGFLDMAQGSAIRTILRTATNPQIIYRGFPVVNYGIDTVLSYSSFGPLNDGRIKPDIVAPGGMVYSAMAGVFAPNGTTNKCSALSSESQGTSTAAALAAGHLALMRQYFRDGFYPAGASNNPTSAPFEPSGMLIKAAAISGARSLNGGVAASTGRVLRAAPDGYQGWGRLDLSGALPLRGVSPANFRIQVVDNGVINHQQLIFLRGIRATGSGPVYATLVWNDYPGSGLSNRDLYNDLDLGFQINQNNLANTTYSRSRVDNVNNVERIEFTTLRANDRITLVVFGRSITHQLLTVPDAQLPQRFAVYVSGHFYGTLKTPFNPLFMRPQRLQAGGPPNTQLGITAASVANGCLTSAAGVVTANATNCGTPVASFTFQEIPVTSGAAAGGFVYSVRDSSGRCLMLLGTALNGRLVSGVCNTSAPEQRMAFFRNPLIVNGTTTVFQIVPQLSLGAGVDDRRCLRAAVSAADNRTFLVLAVCNEDDNAQNFRVERPASVPAGLPLVASPSPPPPSPDRLPDQSWYPYPMVLRTDFYPVNGSLNDIDYDYAIYDDTSTLSNLDIVVSWTEPIKGVMTFYQVGADSTVTVNSPANAVYGGDNVDKLVMYEEVHWRMGFQPPTTTFDVCVNWYDTETKVTRVVLTVFRGYAVTSVTKLFNTAQPQTTFRCNSSAPGYVGSYRMTAGPAPPAPPAAPSPPPPPAAYDDEVLVIRADWKGLSGYPGRENKIIDLDLVVSFAYQDEYVTLGYYNQDVAEGRYGGDNVQAKANSEIAYWPTGTMPPSTPIHACVRWHGGKNATVQVSMSIFAFGELTQSEVRTIDTTLPRNTNCTPQAVGYLGTIDLTCGLKAPPPPPTARCTEPLAASSMFTLYFRTQWFNVQGDGVKGSSSPTLYDWDLVVAWTQNGQPTELSRYNRFASGGVYAGDNTDMPGVVNGEVAYWPTGLTGVLPPATTYHICVRWFTVGTLNVTLVVSLGDEVVRTTTRVLSSADMNGKFCAPGTNGYVGSYDYKPASNSGGAVVGATSMGITSTYGMPNWVSGAAQATGSTAKEGTDDGSAPGSSPAAGGGSNGGDVAPGGQSGDSGVGAPSPSPEGSVSSESGPQDVGGNAGSDGEGSGSATLPIVLGTVLGGTVLIALTVLAVRWRRSKLRHTRVVALT